MSNHEKGDQGPKARVAETLRRALEGEVVEVAYSPSRTGADTHSKTGVANHSKQGHDHSKATIRIAATDLDPVEDAKYKKFAEELARVKSAVDQKTK